MSFFAGRVGASLWQSLKLAAHAPARCVSRPIRLRGIVAMPMAILFSLCAIALTIFVCIAAPLLLICAWLALTPLRLWLFFRRRMIGRRFFV